MLDNRHIEALNLLRSGFSVRETAAKIGISYDTLYDWCEGKPSVGPAAVEFGVEFKTFRKKIVDETRQDVEDTLSILAKKFKVWIGQVVTKKPSQEDAKIATNLYRVLEDSAHPKSDITNIYNIGIKTSGDALNEFKRYRVLLGRNGKGASNRGGVQAAELRRSAGLLESHTVRSRSKKAGKGGKLPTQSEAGSVPSVEGADSGDLRGE